MKERVAILGASDDPSRYANRAQHMLLDYGHMVVPVNPQLAEVDGKKTVPDLDSIEGAVDTVTVYMRAQLSEPLGDAIVRLKPKRVIFNPGAESPALRKKLEAAGIRVQWECTLVLLRTRQFEAA
jgi:predicted CoA-binding protein